jgi:hypothetical protein
MQVFVFAKFTGIDTFSSSTIRPTWSHRGDTELGQQTFRAVRNRFVQSDVDHLTGTAVYLSMVKGEKNSERAVQGGKRIAEGVSHTDRRPSRLSGEIPHSSHRIRHDTESKAVTIRLEVRRTSPKPAFSRLTACF